MKKCYVSRLLIVWLIFIAVFIDSCSKKDNSAPIPTPEKTTPFVAVISISQGPYNTSIQITGAGFSPTAADNQVLFNGKAATVTSATTTTLTATVPAGAGTGIVTVKLKDGTILNGPVFNYQLTATGSLFAGSSDDSPEIINGPGVIARFIFIAGMAIDAGGNIYVADYNLIRKITPAGDVSAPFFANATCIAVDGAGDIYYAEAGTIHEISNNKDKVIASGFSNPNGIAIDSKGNLYVADTGNQVIKKITATGVVTILAGVVNNAPGYRPPFHPVNGPGATATFNTPVSVAVDAAGNVYVCDIGNFMIRKITAAGDVSTLAGGIIEGKADGTGVAASFGSPTDIVMGQDGNMLIVDDDRIRKMTPEGVVTTIIGQGSPDHTSNDPLNSLSGANVLVKDAAGNVYIASSYAAQGPIISKFTFK